MAQNRDVWIGWTYWAAGAWWPKDYFTSVQPLNGADRPQMNVLIKHVARGHAPSAR
jgi:endoglucanase